MELNEHNDYIGWLIEWVWSVGGCGLLPGERKRCTSHRKPFHWLPHAPAGEEGRERERKKERGRGREGERWYMYVLYNIFNTSRTTFFNFTNLVKLSTSQS